MLPLDLITRLSSFWPFCIAAFADSFSTQVPVSLPHLQFLWVELTCLKLVFAVDTFNFTILGFTE